jgi:hypothetical protein
MLKLVLMVSLMCNIILLTWLISVLDVQVSQLSTTTSSATATATATTPVASTANTDNEQSVIDTTTSTVTLSPSQSTQDVRKQILALAQAQDWQTLKPILTDYLLANPQDWAITFIEGQFLIHTETSATGLAYLYGVLNNVDDSALANQIQRYIDQHVRQLTQALAFNQDWYALALLLEPLLQIEPLSRVYIEYLALSYAKQNLPNAMRNVLAALPNDDPLVAKINQVWAADFSAITPSEALAAEAQLPTPQPSALIQEPLTALGNQYIVSSVFAGQGAQLLLDTGATTTALSQNAFARIPSANTRFLGRIVVNTASGQSQGELYAIGPVAFAQQTFAELNVVVLPINELAAEFDGLLGMNLLNRFAWQLDGAQSALLLAPKITP